MTSALPIVYRRIGDTLVCDKRYKKLFDRQFQENGVYILQRVESRDMRSHRHFFAAVREGWMNLAEEFTERFPTETHLRKWALVQNGYAKERLLVLQTREEAIRVGLMMRELDEYAVIVPKETVLQIYTAFSMKELEMAPEIFKKAKRSVLDTIASMARTTAQQLSDESRRHPHR